MEDGNKNNEKNKKNANKIYDATASRRGIYFREDSLMIISHRNYSHIPIVLSKALIFADTMSRNLSSMTLVREAQEHCTKRVREEAAHLTKSLEEIRTETKGRDKREIRWLSNALKWATGVADADDWDHMVSAIDTMKEGLTLDRDEMMLVKKEMSGNAKMMNKTMQIMQKLEDHEKKIEDQLNTYNGASTVALNIGNICEEKVNLIKQGRTDLRELNEILLHGKLRLASPVMITRENIAEGLMRAAGMSTLHPLWPIENMGNYYWAPLARTIFNEKTLTTVMSLEIPLVDKSDKLYLYPTMKRDSEKIVVNDQHSWYRYLSNDDLDNCDDLGKKALLCYGRYLKITNIVNLCGENNDCTSGLTLPYSHVREVMKDTLEYKFDRNGSAIVKCREESPRKIQLPQQGRLYVPPTCALTSRLFTVKARKELRGSNIIYRDVQHEDWNPITIEEQFQAATNNIMHLEEQLHSKHNETMKWAEDIEDTVEKLQGDLSEMEETINEAEQLDANQTKLADKLHTNVNTLAYSHYTHSVGLSITAPLVAVSLTCLLTCMFFLCRGLRRSSRTIELMRTLAWPGDASVGRGSSRGGQRREFPRNTNNSNINDNEANTTSNNNNTPNDRGDINLNTISNISD